MAESTEHKFTPAWWVPGPHAQTLCTQLYRRPLPRDLRVERIPTPDGDQLYLYHRDLEPGRLRLVMLHGLEGSVRSHYVAGFAAEAERRGWNFTLLVFRGCGPELNSGRRLYHSGETTDLGFVVGELIRRDPGASLFLAGVSMGGNVLLKWLGEAGAERAPQIQGAAGVSVPFELEAGARNLQRGFARVYDRHFLKSLRRKAFLKLEQHPDLFDRDRLVAARTIEDFDDAVTGPVHGFAGSHDYYSRSSSIAFLPAIRVATLLLSAEDDPFLPRAVLARVTAIASANRALRTEFTANGGHVGFIAGRIPFRPHAWAESRVMAFFDSLNATRVPR